MLCVLAISGRISRWHQTADETARFIAELALVANDGVQCFVLRPFTSLAGAAGVDELFVGRAAWTPDGFARVLKAAAL